MTFDKKGKIFPAEPKVARRPSSCSGMHHDGLRKSVRPHAKDRVFGSNRPHQGNRACVLDLPDEVVVSVTELACREPGCPEIETVVAILSADQKPLTQRFMCQSPRSQMRILTPHCARWPGMTLQGGMIGRDNIDDDQDAVWLRVSVASVGQALKSVIGRASFGRY